MTARRICDLNYERQLGYNLSQVLFAVAELMMMMRDISSFRRRKNETSYQEREVNFHHQL